jgi:hypothetical protein
MRMVAKFIASFHLVTIADSHQSWSSAILLAADGVLQAYLQGYDPVEILTRVAITGVMR